LTPPLIKVPDTHGRLATPPQFY